MDNKILDNIEDELKNGSFDKAENKENIIRHIEQLKKQRTYLCDCQRMWKKRLEYI